MRTVCALVVAAASVAAIAATPAEDKKLVRPPLESKEWKKRDSGLEVWDVKEGKGEAVKEGATVTVHYAGWLTDKDATLFDSSYKRGEPATFSLDGVIKGWTEGIPGMKPGGVRRLKIPAKLAYGEREIGGGLIPANSTLVFEVELVK